MSRSGDVSISLNRIALFVVLLTVGGCGDRQASDSANSPDPSLPGVYGGVFPCDGCAGIDTTLWLKSDGRFFYKQTYPADEGREAMDAYNFGRWGAIDDNQTIELRGSGPRRVFQQSGRDTLMMQSVSDLEYRLDRDSGSPEFLATIRMTGTIHVRGDSAVFSECLTGYEVPVNKGGDYRRFRHQYRSAGGADRAAPVELEGRFSWGGDGTPRSLVIERFISVRDDPDC